MPKPKNNQTVLKIKADPQKIQALYFAAANLPILFVIRLLHRVSYGMASTAVSTIVTGSIAKERHGEGIGYFMLSITVGEAIGPFFGMFLIQHGGYAYIFGVCAITACICLFAALSLKHIDEIKEVTNETRVKEEQKAKK